MYQLAAKLVKSKKIVGYSITDGKDNYEISIQDAANLANGGLISGFKSDSKVQHLRSEWKSLNGLKTVGVSGATFEPFNPMLYEIRPQGFRMNLDHLDFSSNPMGLYVIYSALHPTQTVGDLYKHIGYIILNYTDREFNFTVKNGVKQYNFSILPKNCFFLNKNCTIDLQEKYPEACSGFKKADGLILPYGARTRQEYNYDMYSALCFCNWCTFPELVDILGDDAVLM